MKRVVEIDVLVCPHCGGAPFARTPRASGPRGLSGSGSRARVRLRPEEGGVMVAQYEHSLYLSADGVEILTA